jgi:hypothetical protein
MSVVLHLLNTNNQQIKLQEQKMEAYYLAYSGAELAREALFKDNNELFNNIKSGREKEYTENLILDNGQITITAEQSNNENYPSWIEIKSTSTLNDTDITYTRILYINPEDPGEQVWVN